MTGRQVRALAAEHLELVVAQAFLFDFRVEVLDQAREPPGAMHAENPPARHVDVAGQGRDNRNRAHGLNSVRRVLDGAAPLHHRGLELGKEPRGGADLVRRHPGDGLGPLRRHLVDVPGELLEPMAIVLDEIVVVKIFLDDRVDHCERERVVRSRANLQPELGFAGDDGLARIDRDDARPAQQRLADVEAGFAIRARVGRVVAPVHDELGIHVAREIADGQIAHGLDAGVDPGVETLGEAGLAPVGCAERVAEP